MLKHIAAAALAASILTPADAFAAVTIAPHRAVYDLTLKKASQRAGLSSVEGRMAIEVAGSSCDGYTVNFRMVNRFKPREGEVRLIDTQSASWESGDGMSMRYNQQEFIDHKRENESKISASRDANGGEGKGKIEKPTEEEFTLAPETIFPMAHQIKLMKEAERGDSRDSSLVFDGSDGAKTYRAITFIGRAESAGSSSVEGPPGETLRKLKSWPMSVSYYPSGQAAEDTPSYQVSFQLYENGVASRLVLDYGDFSLAGTLTNLEFLGEAVCN
jgi:hypothetical protein